MRPFKKINELRQEAEVQFRAKERELLEELKQTEARIDTLQKAKGQEDTLVLSDAQRDEVARFRAEKIRIRRELRDVRHDLQRDIDALEGAIKFINTGLMPIVVVILGLIVAANRVRRRRAQPAPSV